MTKSPEVVEDRWFEPFDPNNARLFYFTPQPQTLFIGNIVSLNYETGEVKRLAGFTTTDAAALAFWQAVETLAKQKHLSAAREENTH